MTEKTVSTQPPPRRGERLAQELAGADADLAAGELAEAERRAKAISLRARAAKDVAELKALEQRAPEEEDIEEIRAELERRLLRFIECDRENRLPPGVDRPPRQGVD